MTFMSCIGLMDFGGSSNLRLSYLRNNYCRLLWALLLNFCNFIFRSRADKQRGNNYACKSGAERKSAKRPCCEPRPNARGDAIFFFCIDALQEMNAEVREVALIRFAFRIRNAHRPNFCFEFLQFHFVIGLFFHKTFFYLCHREEGFSPTWRSH